MSDERVDRIGAVASGLCAAHCAVCALLPAVFGALGVGFLLDPVVEWAFTLVAVAFASVALALGWRRHRSRRVAALLLAGIVGLLVARGLESGDHHGHDAHVAEHAAAEAHTTPGQHAETDPHHDAAGEHADAGHLLGAGIGILAGLLLLTGHVLNLRATRCCEPEDACS